jgi:hypothetical protein
MRVASVAKPAVVVQEIHTQNRKARQRHPLLVVLALALMAVVPVGGARAQGPPQEVFGKLVPNDAATREGFNYFYNMEYSGAAAEFEKSLSDHPNNPYALNHLLETVLFQELHREGKLDAELYLSNEFVHAKKVVPNPEAIERFQKLLSQTLEVENWQLAAQPNDISALYARSVTRGLRATKEGLIDKAWFTALRSALGAYDDSKRVLELDPSYSDAKLIVGIYNYVVGSLPWPVKFAAFLATIHGSQSKGLALIRDAVEGRGEASVDARTTLALFLAREHRYPEALDLIQWLYAVFPHNFLYGISEAGLLKSAGKPQEAIHAYRRLIELAKQGQFPNQDVELAAMGLGILLRARGDWRGAAEAYDTVETLPHPDPDLVLQAQLSAGQMYDLAGERQLAVKHYQEVAQQASDPQLAEQARSLLKQPYQKNPGD